MIHAMVSGHLVGRPETRTARSGRNYVSARLAAGEQTVWVTAFNGELDGLGDGDAVSVVGELTASVYEGTKGPGVAVRLLVRRVMRMDEHETATPWPSA